jgi:hypothetical protein
VGGRARRGGIQEAEWEEANEATFSFDAADATRGSRASLERVRETTDAPLGPPARSAAAVQQRRRRQAEAERESGLEAVVPPVLNGTGGA